MTIKANRKQNYGQYFTSSSITEFMVQLVMDEIKSNSRLKNLDVSDISVLEPAAGEGAFLETLLSNDFENITAYEIDNTIYEKLIDNFGNAVLVNNHNFLESSEEEKYDLIVGNPPYLGQNYASEIFQEYCNKYELCKEFFCGNMDLFYYFIHAGIRKLKPGGLLCFITTNYWVKKGDKTGIKKLKPHIIEDCLLNMYIDLSNLKVFKEAPGQHNCIFILQKKTDEEKMNRLDKKIKIIQFKKSKGSLEGALLERNYLSYDCAITNNELKKNGIWNLLYPEVVEKVVDKIESFCKYQNGKTLCLKDFFQIRNGIISIKDDVFILREKDNLVVKNGEFYVKINGSLHKLNDFEKDRLKKLYKGRCIIPFGYNEDDYLGWIIFFDKREFQSESFNPYKKYPVLMKYLSQYESELRKTLIQCKESPENWLFLRRGFKVHNLRNKKGNQYLESYYEKAKKIFFPYISKENNFGFTTGSFYATSDTYFMHNDGIKADMYFFIAYLNSKLIKFVFKAKGLEVKRSKSKIENGIPIISVESFTNQNQRELYNEIKLLSIEITRNPKQNLRVLEKIDSLMFHLFEIDEDLINQLLSTYY